MVVADNKSIQTTHCGIARIACACIVVITVVVREVAAILGIAVVVAAAGAIGAELGCA
jgi:hypothetical protein